MATLDVPSGRNIIQLGTTFGTGLEIDLAAEAGNTIIFAVVPPTAFIGTTAVSFQMVFTGATALADGTELQAFNSLTELPTPIVNMGPTITDGSSLVYAFVDGNEILTEEVTISTLEWLYCFVEVPVGADAGTLKIYLKTKQN